ncbi:hypothetical protein RRG08_059923 [Elysia crispata]|uniref:Uncharacterized protein n=1 Tax=Elysia crispata TaxID=231223 RepID=A0AAE0Y6K2_9GAST|nr:hypothetical protein RRG08_059923 [Elysia crispata]
MATEITVKILDNTLGQAFLVKQEEWDLCISEIRAIMIAQEIETPSQYRFLTKNGNVISPTLETVVTFRDVVEREPFAEIKKEDTSLHSAEQRVAPQVTIISVDDSREHPTSPRTENQCPFINKFPYFAGARGTLPCMRNIFNVHTLLKLAFILTCLLFLMIFVLTLGFHLLFGIGAVGGFTGHGAWGGFPMHQHQYSASPVDQEALTALKVKLSEMEVANRFETKDLKQKLAEFEDMYLSQFRELEALKQELSAAKASQSALGKLYEGHVDNLSTRLSNVEDSMLERWQPQHTDFTSNAEAEHIINDNEVSEEKNVEEERRSRSEIINRGLGMMLDCIFAAWKALGFLDDVFVAEMHAISKMWNIYVIIIINPIRG